jgi:two-component system C4-dicarboxylate transport sensor histidine kinase DctB
MPDDSPDTQTSIRDALLTGDVSVQDVMRRSRIMMGALLVVLAMLATGLLAYEASWRQGLAAARSNTEHKLELFNSAMEGMLNRLETVPATIQLNQEVLALLAAPQPNASTVPVNAYLAQLNAQLGSLAVYVLNPRGTVVATSNYREAGSFMGEDLSFRPYFLTALAGQVGRHFAIGNTSRQPGYYLANPIRQDGRIVGVAVIKISLQPVQQLWAMLGSPALIIDEHEVIILASEPDWLYQRLAETPIEKRIELQIAQLYSESRLRLFPLGAELVNPTEANKRDGLVLSGHALQERLGRTLMAVPRDLRKMGWRLWSFHEVDGVRKQAVMVAMLSAVATGFVCLLWLVVQQRQRLVRQKLAAKRMLEKANSDLESKVVRRTSALASTNERLRKEVAERIQAEHTLREAQDELIQAAKLAAVGQMSTGITHELSQPLGAIRTLAGNSSAFLQRGDLATVGSNLALITRLSEQMGEIVQSLKGFARKAPATATRMDLAQAVNNALLLFVARLRSDQVNLRNDCQDEAIEVWGEPNRLEQVIVNVIGNALDAMKDQPARQLHLHTEVAEPHRIRLLIDDNGPGLPAHGGDRIFEPFFTTKPRGEGLGLGLSISRDIVRSFQGELQAENLPGGGARFIIELSSRVPEPADLLPEPSDPPEFPADTTP